MATLNQYGRALLRSLELGRPKILREMTRAGSLSEFLTETQERAQNRHHDLLRQLRRDNPPPADPSEQVAQLAQLDRVAEELVLNEVIYPALGEDEDRASGA